MPPIFTGLILLLAFCLPLLLVLWWPTRDWRFGVLVAGVMLSGWMLLICDAAIAKYSHDADIYERASLGLPVAPEEYSQDGVGDNAIALFLGWVVPTIGAGIGFIAVTIRRRKRKGRRFAVEPAPAAGPPASTEGALK